MFSFGVKIQILLVMIVILVGLYLFVLQKEMKLMQQDFTALKKQLEMVQHPSNESKHRVLKQEVVEPVTCKVKSGIFVDVEDVEDVEDDEDDEASVSSLEIKEILTNIDIDETGSHTSVCDETKCNDIVGEDLSLFVESELDKLKCEDLRNYLRSRNMDIKGKKPELIQKIMSIRD